MIYKQVHQNSHQNNKSIEIMLGCKTNANPGQEQRNAKAASDNDSSIVKPKVQD